MSLQLSWHHQFQFAGYYAAQEKGFYAQQGLRVSLLDGGYMVDGRAVVPAEAVLAGRADFGITRSDLLLDRLDGLPLVALAAIFQRSPFVLLSTVNSGITRLQDIGRRPVTLTLLQPGQHGRVDGETLAMLHAVGIDPARLNNKPPSWRLEDLAAGITQLMPAYRSNEPFLLSEMGVTPVLLRPEDYGVDFYGDVLFTSEAMIRRCPDVVVSFRRASLKGWRYALDHPAEIIDLIVQRYPQGENAKQRERLVFEAHESRVLIQPDLIEIGYMNRHRWQSIADTYVRIGLAEPGYSLDGFFYASDNDPEKIIWREIKRWLLGGGVVLLGISALLFHALIINRRLQREVKNRIGLEQQLREMASTDPLTGLYNRREFFRRANDEISRARRYGRDLTVLMIDVDHFKQINDRFGHATGDKVLQEITALFRSLHREHDLLSRIGGEEFAMVVTEIGREAAYRFAERLRRAVAEARFFGSDERPEQVTISIGIAALTDDVELLDEILRRADEALYRAKADGRNRIVEFAQETASELQIF